MWGLRLTACRMPYPVLPQVFDHRLNIVWVEALRLLTVQFSASFLGAFAKLWKADYWLCRVCPSARVEQLGSHRTDFYEIGYYASIFRKSTQRIQVSLKSDKNNGYFTWRPICIYDYTSCSCLLWMRNVSDSDLPLYGVPRSPLFRYTSLDRRPLDERSVRRSYLYLTTHNTHKRQTSMLPVGFEHTISTSKRP